MPQSLRLVARAALWIIGLYAVLWVVASIWVGRAAPTLDTDRGLTDIYKTDVREFVYRLPAFCEEAKNRKNLIVVGGSTASAYDPAVVGPFVKDWAVSRIAIDFGTVIQMRQSIAMLRQCMDPQTFASTRFVLGLSYVSMANSKHRFPTPYTMLELEQMRHGLFAGEPGQLRPTVSWPSMKLAVEAGRPVILAHYAVTGLSDSIGAARLQLGKLRQGAKPEPAQAAREAEEVGFYDAMMDAPPAEGMAEQASELAALVAEVRAAGSDIAVIAVPEQSFVRREAKYITAYYDWLAGFATDHDVKLLRHAAADGDFRDGVHADVAGSAKWSRAIGPAVAGLLNSGGL